MKSPIAWPRVSALVPSSNTHARPILNDALERLGRLQSQRGQIIRARLLVGHGSLDRQYAA